LTEKFPKHETYALADQIRRAVALYRQILQKVKQEKHPETFADS